MHNVDDLFRAIIDTLVGLFSRGICADVCRVKQSSVHCSEKNFARFSKTELTKAFTPSLDHLAVDFVNDTFLFDDVVTVRYDFITTDEILEDSNISHKVLSFWIVLVKVPCAPLERGESRGKARVPCR